MLKSGINLLVCEICTSEVPDGELFKCISCAIDICSACTFSSSTSSSSSSTSASGNANDDIKSNHRLCSKCLSNASETSEALIARIQALADPNASLTDEIRTHTELIESHFAQPQQKKVSARDLIELITVQNHWVCRSCSIYGTYKSPHHHFCGGAYFGWLIGATPTEGRTCCNCVKRVTGSDAGYILWSCSQCKVRKSALSALDFNSAGFEVGMSKFPLNTPAGMSWLLIEAGEQSGPEWMRRIRNLDLSGLQFTSLNSLFTAPLASFTNILKIDISNNSVIESIPIEEVCGMENLVEFECTNCPRLISPPPEIAAQGGKAVMMFLRLLVSDGKHNTSMVLFLIGDGESGKTSLLSALKAEDNKSKKIDRDDRTVGIDILKWSLHSNYAIDYTVYDMAGQSIYKDTHTYFVGRRAIYLFVWRLVPSADVIDIYARLKAMVESWIDTLQFRIPGASVMSIATHADCVTSEEAQSQTRQVLEIIRQRAELYVNHNNPLRIWNNGDSIVLNSLDGSGIDECRSQLLGFSKSLPWYNELLPKSWIDLEEILQAKSTEEGADNNYFLQWNDYAQVVVGAGVPAEMVLSVTRFFHETGKLRYFGTRDSTVAPISPRNATGEKAAASHDGDSTPTSSSPSSSSSSSPSPSPKNNKSLKIGSGLIINSFMNLVSGKSKKQDKKIIRESSFFLSDKDVEATLNDTVYISPVWLCNVLKGIIRHERDSLLRYFLKTNNQVLLRRVKRLLKCGRMHSSLAEYTYPSTKESSYYWRNSLSPYERDLWSGDIVHSESDIIRAFSVLSGFDLVAVKGHEFIIPSLIGPCNFLKSSEAHKSVDQLYECTFEYLSLPSGFFERIIIRLTRLMSHMDMTAKAAYLYSLGNVGSVFVSNQKDASRLLISASAKALFDVIKNEVVKVEQFFPGLHRQSLSESTDPRINDIPQILIVSSSVSMVGSKIQAIIHAKHPSLVIKHQAAKSFHLPDVLNARIGIICMDKNIHKTKHAISCVKSLFSEGTFLIPVIMEGYEISNYTHWWPSVLPELESHKLFVDLRENIEIQVNKQLLPVVIKKLNDWRGKTASALNNSNAILCEQCVIDCCSTFSSFQRDACRNCIDEWYTKKLSSYAKAEDVDEDPSVSCANGHVYDPRVLISKTSARDSIPCQSCLAASVSKPFLFDREELILQFEDDIKKVGLISCPDCVSAGRSGTFHIVDVLNTDVFFTYNWGNGRLTQNFIVPFVRKIELETNILCWFDIHGGLTAGQDHIKEMSAGVAKCSIVVLCLTDSYVTSQNCQREFIQSVKLGKYIIPILLPQFFVDGVESVGWSGSDATSSWWKHAEELTSVNNCGNDPDNNDQKIPWFILQNFHPIDLRTLNGKTTKKTITAYNGEEGKKENNSHENNANEYLSTAGEEIICRVLARLHRGRHVKAFE